MGRRGGLWLTLLLSGCPSLDATPLDGLGHAPRADSDDYGRLAVGGIDIDRVTVDQGVSVDVVVDGVLASPEEHRTKIVSGRNANVRAFWSYPESWEPRDIEARIRVRLPDGSTEAASQVLEIDGPPNENWVQGAFSWYIPGEWLGEDTEFDITLYETSDFEPGPDAPVRFPRVPAEGSAPLGVSEQRREMDVVVVPIDHAYEGGKECGGPPVLDDQFLADMERELRALNPVEKINISAHDVYVFDQPADKFAVILDELSALREIDDAPPYVYYYGLIDLCDWGSDQGFSGQARVPDEITLDYAWKRVAVGTIAVSYGGMIETFVHEMGHTQGRLHVPCSGEKSTVDDYPYRDARIASVGFDIVDWTLHPATHRDYMSYCGPEWVGDYGWNAVLPVTETLTQWKLDGLSFPAGVQSLVGSVYPDGDERWWVVRGAPPIDADSGTLLRYVEAGRSTEVPARVRPHLFDDGLEVVAPLPVSLDEVASIERSGLPGPASMDVQRVAR